MIASRAVRATGSGSADKFPAPHSRHGLQPRYPPRPHIGAHSNVTTHQTITIITHRIFMLERTFSHSLRCDKTAAVRAVTADICNRASRSYELI